MTTHLGYTVVDAFTDKIFSGNPASIIVLEEGQSFTDSNYLLVAREFNLSETAFVTPKPEANTKDSRSFGLRWFTPSFEIPLCGHATLASAHVLFSTSAIIPEDINIVSFDTMSGTLIAKRLENGEIELEFPAGNTKKADADLEAKAEDAIKKALGDSATIKFAGVGEGVSFGKYLLIEVDQSFDLEGSALNIEPIVNALPSFICVIVTARSADPKVTFVSRVFGPNDVPEDPVTGSAHCMLGPYWQKQLQLASGEEMVAKQVSERGGYLTVIWDEKNGTCKLKGKAVVVAKGEFYMPA